MIEQVLENIYRIEVGLPQNPLRSLNAYLIKDNKRSVLIDTGMNRRECLADLTRALHTLCSEKDARGINDMTEDSTWDMMCAVAVQHGFDPREAFEAVKNHPAKLHRNREKIDFTFVQEGGSLKVGGYNFGIIETPGHTDGHICLYEPERGLFISGDHVLYDISPIIVQWDPAGTPFKDYLASLRKVSGLEVVLALPGHRNTFTCFRERIDELQAHHANRLDEIEATLHEGPQSSLEIASKVSWHINIRSFADFPPQQKLFACGEALAHLVMLVSQGRVVRVDHDGRTFFHQRLNHE